MAQSESLIPPFRRLRTVVVLLTLLTLPVTAVDADPAAAQLVEGDQQQSEGSDDPAQDGAPNPDDGAAQEPAPDPSADTASDPVPEPDTITADGADPATPPAEDPAPAPDAASGDGGNVGSTDTEAIDQEQVNQETVDQETVDQEPVGADPLSNEGPGEEAPDTDVTVPPNDTYVGQEPYEPPEILWSSVAAADQKLGEAEEARRTAIVEVRRLRKRLKELEIDRDDLDEETVAALNRLGAATDRLRDRAVVGYQHFGSGSTADPEATISDYQGVIESQRRAKLADSALVVGEADIEELDALRGSLNIEALALLDRARVVADHLADAEAGIKELNDEAEQAAVEYEAFKAGSEIFIHGVVFPIAGDYDEPFDSYGFPRMPGTPDEHWHEGIDLFAPRGTPLVATERGVITKLGSGRLGGLKLWIIGESGSEWYYAHLDAFAPGMADGVVVEAGQLIGYVGNTGNAVGTPPHLHMQLHPGGGEPVNPYPLLKVVSDLDRAAMAAGTHPGYAYEAILTGDLSEVAQPEEPEPTEDGPEGDVDPATAPNVDTGSPDDGSPDAATPDVASTGNPDTGNPSTGNPGPAADGSGAETPAPDPVAEAPGDDPTAVVVDGGVDDPGQPGADDGSADPHTSPDDGSALDPQQAPPDASPDGAPQDENADTGSDGSATADS